MSNEQLISALKQIEALVAECLKAPGSAPDKPASPRQAKSVDRARKKTLSDHILELRDKAVFSEPQTAREVHEKLQASYPCMLNRKRQRAGSVCLVIRRNHGRLVWSSIQVRDLRSYRN